MSGQTNTTLLTAPLVGFRFIFTAILKLPAKLLGFAGNWFLFGCTCVQVYLYHLGFRNDGWRLKSLVYGLCIWDTAQTFTLTSTVFDILASGWGNQAALERTGLIWLDIPIMSGVASAVVQCFYAWRIYALGRSIPLVLLIIALALMEGCAALALGIIIKTSIPTFAALQSNTYAVTSIWLLGSAACDILISASMLYLLTRARKITRYSRTDTLLSRIIKLTVGGGLLTTSIAIVDAILYLIFPHNNLHTVPGGILAKLYTNALMVLLNNRKRHLDSSTYTWDDESEPPAPRNPGVSSKYSFNRGQRIPTPTAIEVDVSIDRMVDAGSAVESFSMGPMERETADAKITWNADK
ncbi:hypothetical protein GYMLUDRAFT_254329 [Collybiopsis luxurians FD-317 M1]|nr:hypothetical protein GYMLUDRAFT_254329 [Collybiopsis luxurians FD-317 M1]